ncbi:hypothetical protein ACOSP7_023670 [Xanthoceras sorbifolium]
MLACIDRFLSLPNPGSVALVRYPCQPSFFARPAKYLASLTVLVDCSPYQSRSLPNLKAYTFPSKIPHPGTPRTMRGKGAGSAQERPVLWWYGRHRLCECPVPVYSASGEPEPVTGYEATSPSLQVPPGVQLKDAPRHEPKLPKQSYNCFDRGRYTSILVLEQVCLKERSSVPGSSFGGKECYRCSAKVTGSGIPSRAGETESGEDRSRALGLYPGGGASFTVARVESRA